MSPAYDIRNDIRYDIHYHMRHDSGRSPMNHSRPGRLATAAILTLGALCLLVAVPASAGAATRHLGAGTATFSLDPAEAIEFVSNGIVPCPISPATMSFAASRVTFKMPISGGTWSPSALKGTFLLKGGLSYARAGATTFTVLNLTGWRAGVNNSTGFSISANGHRSSTFFDENLMGSTPSVVKIHGHKYAKVTNVLLFFNATSTGAISGALGASPPSGDPFGAVTFLARLK